MTITSYHFVYGCPVSYSLIWEFLNKDDPTHSNDNEDQKHDWVTNFLHYKSRSGPVPKFLWNFHKEVQKRNLFCNPLFAGFAVNIPHDQVSEFDEKERHYGAVGIFSIPEDAKLSYNDLKIVPDQQKYEEFLEKFKETVLYDILKNPQLMVIQDDCGCCS